MDGCQAGAVLESLPPYARYAVGDGDRGQAGAVFESIFPYAPHIINHIIIICYRRRNNDVTTITIRITGHRGNFAFGNERIVNPANFHGVIRHHRHGHRYDNEQ